MKLTVSNFRRIARASIEVHSLCILGGANEAGKSTLCQALAATLTGDAKFSDQLGKLTEKELPLLIHDRADTGEILLEDEHGSRTLSFPSGRCSASGAVSISSPMAVGQLKLSGMDARERARYVTDMLQSLPTEDDVRQALKDLAPGAWKIIQQHGWDGALTNMKDTLIRTKGAWEAVTKQRYGSNKAQSWAPDEFTPIQLAQLNPDTLAAAKVELEAELEKAIGSSAVSAAERDQWTVAAAELPKLEQALRLVRKTFADVKKEREQMPADPTDTVPCPHCQAPVVIIGQVLSKPATGTLTKEQLTALRTNRATADGKLARARDEVWRLEGLIRSATEARDKLAQAAPATDPADPEPIRARIADVTQQLASLTQYREATLHHQRIVKMQAVVDALLPEGLRQAALHRALGAFNAHCAEVCAMAGWGKVGLDAEVKLTLDGRSYRWLSDGAKYRVDAVVQLVMAKWYDKSSVVIFDRAGELDQAGRNGLAKAIKKLELRGVMAMWMKSPEDLPKVKNGDRAYWVEAGEVRAA